MLKDKIYVRNRLTLLTICFYNVINVNVHGNNR